MGPSLRSDKKGVFVFAWDEDVGGKWLGGPLALFEKPLKL